MSVDCPLCFGTSYRLGSKVGAFRGRTYDLARCARCRLAFVEKPDLDYAEIYDRAYYAGEGADPFVDYSYELTSATKTIRRFEWRGVYDLVRSLRPIDSQTRWLDYGCGAGGLVRYLRERGVAAEGFDEGGIVEDARAHGIPIIDSAELPERSGRYDVVTAIEVLEHLASPRECIESVAALLKPGGIFFYTTGNAARFSTTLLGWPYFNPEIHVTLYEPRTAELALLEAGLEARYIGWRKPFADIITFKILKNVRVRDHSIAGEMLARSPIPRVVDRRYGVSAFPIGIKPAIRR